MRTISREVTIWAPPGQRPAEAAIALAAEAGAWGGARAVARRRALQPDATVGYAHGERHDLWWEFHLSASFRWQAHICRMNPTFCRQRQMRLTGLFDLTGLMERRVESLSPAERTRANLAVALLPQPDVLVWEEPFPALDSRERRRVCRTLRRLCRTDGLTVIMVANCKEGVEDEREDAARADHYGHGRRTGPARRPAAAGGSDWA